MNVKPEDVGVESSVPERARRASGEGDDSTPTVRHRDASGEDRIRFISAIQPWFARRTHSLDAARPTLYLLGVSSGDFGAALSALVGPGASELSPRVIGRL